jgi:pimeloyl-ACP methyl ester carboxylesterase
MPTAPRRRRRARPEGYGPVGRSAWLDVDWPAHTRRVAVDGRQVNLVDIGGGPATPLLLVHGLAGSWQNWLENIPRFAASRRVVALDLPGFGRSEMPAETISIPGYGQLLGALLDVLGVQRADVVGHSMGGFVSAELALQLPDRVARLVLVSAAGLTVQEPASQRRVARMRRAERLLAFWGAWLATRSDVLAARRRSRRLVLGLAMHRPDLLPGRLLAEQLRASGTPGYFDALSALASYPISHRLGEIAAPTLIVWGALDRIVPVKDAYEFSRLIPGSQRLIFEQTGHMPMIERPQAFNDAVEEFLAGRSPAAPAASP